LFALQIEKFLRVFSARFTDFQLLHLEFLAAELLINFDLDGNGTCETASHVFIRSRDAGLHWESGQSIPGMKQYTSSIGIAADGTLYIADPTIKTPFCSTGTGIALRKSVDGGRTFLAPSCALASQASFQPGQTWTATDPQDSGRIYIAFSAPLGAASEGEHVFVIRSSDAGATWSAPTRVDDVLPEDGVDHLRPSLSVSSTGRLDIAWFDYRHSKPKKYAQNRQSGDVYYSYSTDGGENWAPNVRLSAATAPLIFGAGNDALTIVSSGDKASWLRYYGGGWPILFPNGGDACTVDGIEHASHRGDQNLR
jgi:hypothetical protein